MKKIVFMIFIAMAFCLAGCQNGLTGNENTLFEGTWVNQRMGPDYRFTFSGNEFEQWWDGFRSIGTFTYDETNISLNYTWSWDVPEGREFISLMIKPYKLIDGDLVFIDLTYPNDYSARYVKTK